MPIKSLLENQFAKTKTDCSNLGFYLRKSRQSLKLVDIELSERCNLRCRMCWLYGKNGLGDKYSDNEMTTNEVIDLINQAAVYGSDIYIGGSEPFIRKDLPAILRHIKEKRLSVSFTTNGTLLGASEAERYIEKLFQP
jgi:MoaA/NifB/PqqE/SkfB family radical SAM enzyme